MRDVGVDAAPTVIRSPHAASTKAPTDTCWLAAIVSSDPGRQVHSLGAAAELWFRIGPELERDWTGFRHSDSRTDHLRKSPGGTMCDTHPSEHSVTRRSLLGAAIAGAAGVAIAGSVGAPPAEATTLGSPLRPILPVLPSQPKGPLLTMLGTSGGPQAEYVRTGTSTVLTIEGHNYVVDAGRSSVTQYLNAGLRFSALSGMFITHLHADHLADYYNYFLLEGGEPNAEKDYLTGPLTVYGPGPAGALPPQPNPQVPTIAPENPTPGIKDLTNRLNEGYAYSYNVFMRDTGTRDVTTLQDIHEIAVPDVGASPLGNTAPSMEPFKIFEDDRVKVSAILVPHGPVFPSFAYRFDTTQGSVAFSGDTKLSDNVVKIAQGANMLVHEVIDLDFIKLGNVSPDLLAHLEDSHTTTGQVGTVAEQAGVAKLVLTHLVPSNPLLIPDLVWKAKCSVGFRGTVHVGNDLDRIPMPVRRR